MAEYSVLYCWGNGRIMVGRHLPKNAILLRRGVFRELSAVMSERAAFDEARKVFVVPGVREAGDKAAAIGAIESFRAQLKIPGKGSRGWKQQSRAGGRR